MTLLKMADERFWALIDEARGQSTQSASPTSLLGVLERLETAEVRFFMHHFIENLCDLNKWNLWAAGYAIAGGMSSDGFHYFRSWIIGKGRAVYEIALHEPDDLGAHIDNPEVENELLEYVALNVLEKRGDESDPRDDLTRHADDSPSGDPFNEDEVATMVPKLAAVYLT